MLLLLLAGAGDPVIAGRYILILMFISNGYFLVFHKKWVRISAFIFIVIGLSMWIRLGKLQESADEHVKRIKAVTENFNRTNGKPYNVVTNGIK
jgi:hypothetical protein